MPPPASSSSSEGTTGTLDLSDLECGICLRLLLEPVTLSCGHSLCRSCLARSLNVKRQCPFCRHPCSLNPITHPSTIALAQLLAKYFPDESAARATAAAADGDDLARERGSGPRRLPLLFTRTVEFPNRNVQYVVHEPRYQRLVSDCLAGKREFVAVLDGSDIGCLMTIVDARASLDGRRLVQCRGLQPVRIGDQRDVEMGFGLRSAVIRPVVDVPGSGAGTADLLAACNAEIDRVMEASSGSVAARFYDLDNAVAPEGPSEFSYWAFGLVQCPVSLKLAALSEPDVGQRLHLLMQAIDEWRRRMQRRNWNQTLMFGAVIAFTIAFSVKEHLSSK